MPGWVWVVLVLGVLLTATFFAIFGGLFWVGTQAQLVGEQPKKGVKFSTDADEQLSVPKEGEFRYKNKKTGATRVVFVEGDSAELPEWLTVPPDSLRTEANGKRGNGRHEAAFRYTVPMSAVGLRKRYEGILAAEGWQVRASQLPFLVAVNGVHAGKDREVFLHATPLTENTADLRIRLTEPDGR